MKTINNHIAQTEFIAGKAIIVDVREPAEFKEKHIPGALNLPSTNYDKNHYSGFRDINIYLVCESGKRASQIQNKLANDGFANTKLLETQMQNVQKTKEVKGWSVDRQFRMTLGMLLAIFLILHFAGIKYGIIIPIILSTGLIITSIIDRCYMRMGIAMLPWNREKEY